MSGARRTIACTWILSVVELHVDFTPLIALSISRQNIEFGVGGFLNPLVRKSTRLSSQRGVETQSSETNPVLRSFCTNRLTGSDIVPLLVKSDRRVRAV